MKLTVENAENYNDPCILNKSLINVKDDDMDRLSPCFYDYEIVKLVKEYINDGIYSYSSLDEGEQEWLCAKIMEILGTEIEECIFDNFDTRRAIFHNAKRNLQTGHMDYAIDLVEVLQKHIVEYFKKPLDLLFKQEKSKYDIECKYDAGLKEQIDEQTGEARWVA